MKYALLLGRLLLVVALIECGLSSAWAQAGFDIVPVPVARLGDPVVAPATLGSASEPTLSDTGAVLFHGDNGLLLTSPGRHIVVAAPGDVAPDGRLITVISAGSVNALGQVAFAAKLGSEIFSPEPNALLLFSEGTLTIIAQIGEPAPGGGTFSFFGPPSLNAHGHIAFIASVSQGIGGLMLYANGRIGLVVRDGDLAPGGGAFLMLPWAPVQINDADAIVFVSTPGPTGPGVFLAANGGVMVVARPGMAAPGGGVFGDVGQPSLNAAIAVAFRATATAPSKSGVFLLSDGKLSQIARVGDVVGKDTLDQLSSPKLGDLGQIVFQSSVGQPSSEAIFEFSGGTVRRLVGSGTITREGDILGAAASPSLSGSGEVAFVDDSVAALGRVYRLASDGISRVAGYGDAVLTTPRIVSARVSVHGGQPVLVASVFPGGTAIFDLTGALLLARTGDSAPGGGVLLLQGSVASSEPGVVVFTASLSTGESGLFVSQHRAYVEILRTGTPAPDGGTFNAVSGFSVNRFGRVAFHAFVSTPGRSGIFLASEGVITPVVRVGDLAPDGNPFTEVGLSPALNSSDQVAFSGRVAARPEGLFLSAGSNITAIPYPGNIRGFQLNDAGQVAFSAFVGCCGKGVPTGVFLFDPDTGISDVARPGAPAPGGDALQSCESFSLRPDGPTQIAFSCTFSPTTSLNPGAFLFTDGNLELIARPGDPAPSGDTFTFVDNPRVIADGQILFFAATVSQGTGAFLARRSTAPPHARIDIRPGGPANRINPASDRRVSVAILSEGAFDPATVVADTVRFGATGTEAAALRVVFRDVDEDGDSDMVLRFRIRDTGIQCGQTSAFLTGQTSSGHTIAASDVIRTIGCR